jgi:hypothetical protein
MAAFRGTRAFATIVYGDGPHACAAAVLGRALRILDATIPRVAVVPPDVSIETRDILLRGGLWVLFNASTQDTWLSYQDVRGSEFQRRSPASRKIDLWALPYDAVAFFDVDHVPLVEGRAHAMARRRGALEALWALLAGPTRLVARGEGPMCFNSGLMVLKPSRHQHAALGQILQSMPNRSRFRRCPRGADQPLLNLAFPRWSNLCLPHHEQNCTWREGYLWINRGEAHPLSIGGDGRLRCMLAQGAMHVPFPTDFWDGADSWHFWDPIGGRPWGMTQCLRASMGAGDPVGSAQCTRDTGVVKGASPSRGAVKDASPSRGHVPSCATALVTILGYWWSGFNSLPVRTRQACAARFLRGEGAHSGKT